MTQESVTFKAHLDEDGTPPSENSQQLGWFSLSKELASDIVHIKTKIGFIFSLSKTQEFDVYFQGK